MGQYKKPQNEAEFNANFEQKKPLMNDTEAFYESSRCLFCYDAPCTKACPSDIDVSLFIKQIKTGNIEGAAKTIYSSNWLGNTCAKVCPTSELCEGACVYNNQKVPFVEIGRLQNFATSQVMNKEKKIFKVGESNGKKVAIIGGGPAGIACACELRTLGYEVDIYEAKSKASGLGIHGIAPYKITNEEVEAEIDFLQNQFAYNMLLNSPINNKEQLNELEQNYDAIFLGVGLGATRNLGLDGEDKENVIGAVEFIEEVRLKQHKQIIQDRVVILGGGNTAMDAAAESAKMGAEEVILAYRGSKEGMGAYAFEYNGIVGMGVKSLFHATPVEILGNGKVTGVKFIKTEVNNGCLTKIEGSEFVVECDQVIKATGQAKQGVFLSLIDGLKMDGKSIIQIAEIE